MMLPPFVLAVSAVMEELLRRLRKLDIRVMLPPMPVPRLPTAICAPSRRVTACGSIKILPPVPEEPVKVFANKPVFAPVRLN